MAYRLALATLGATCVLILLGGLVTNTGSALAVPDWPNTFGYNMVLFPWSRMVGGILYEHSHRLMGMLVGVLTLALAAALWREGGRLRRLGLVAVAVVIAQGVLGGLRVVLLEDTLAIFHGCLAQAFFALLAVIALMTAPRARVAAPPIEPALKGLAVLAAVLVYVQIVFGALLTHAGRIDLHLAGALLVFVFVPIVAAQLRRTGDAVAAPISRVISVLLGIQLLFGVGSYLARFSPIWIPGEQLTVTAVPVAHRLIGSLILAATVVLAARVAGYATPARTPGLSAERAGRAGTAPGRTSGLSAETEPARFYFRPPSVGTGLTAPATTEPARFYFRPPSVGTGLTAPATTEPARFYFRPPSAGTGLTAPATTEPARATGLSARPEPRRAYVRPPSTGTGLTDPATTT